MPIAEFIITGFCWVDLGVEKVTAGVKLRTRGFAPRLSDSEVITMEMGGEFLGYDGDEAIWQYFKQHWASWLPGLGDRSTCVRQAANLWRVKQLLHQQWVRELGAGAADCHIIDGFPIKVCPLVRAPRSQNLTVDADYGYCAAKDEYDSGLRANVLIDRRGGVVGLTITAAHVEERDSAYEVLPAIIGVLLGDNGYSRPPFKADGEAVGIDLQTPVRKNMIEQRPRWWLKLLRRVRKRVETVISQREQRCELAKTRARDAGHLTNQVTRTLVAHTVGVWLNIQQGRAPLQLDGVVTA